MWLQAPTIFSHSNSHITWKKYLLTKNYLLIKKKLSFQTQTVELFLTILNFLCIHFFSVCYLYVDFFQVSLDLILCSQIGWVTFSLKYFPIMQCYECFLSCWLWMFTFTNANVSMIQQLFQRMAELANTKHHWLGLSYFSLLAITININIIPI